MEQRVDSDSPEPTIVSVHTDTNTSEKQKVLKVKPVEVIKALPSSSFRRSTII